MEKPLYIPPSKTYTGLTVFCTKCNTNVAETCRNTDKPIQRCPFADKHRFKIYIHKPGTKNKRITKIFTTRNLDQAIAEAIEFKKELAEKGFAGGSALNKNNHAKIEYKRGNHVQNETKPESLLEVQSRYLGFMSGDKEICPSYMFRPRSKEHLSDISRGMDCMVDALKEAKYPVAELKITDIDKHAVGIFYDYMHQKKLSGRTINKYLGYWTTMYKWLIKQEGYSIQNIFEGVRRNSVKAQEVESITEEEIARLLEAFKDKELGKENLQGKIKSLWKPWLAPATRLSLFSGRRGAEIFQLRFSSIIEEKGKMAFIRSEDIKVNKIRNLQGDARKYVSIPITTELKKLLIELGYHKNKGTSKYLIANDEKMQRDTMARHLWRAFGIYAKAIKLNKTFKSLRKTHASSLAARIGAENARIITGHSGLKVLEDHYLDKKIIGKVAQDFSVFR